MTADQISRSAENVKRATVELVQLIGMIDGNYDVKLSEIRNLESKKEKLKEEVVAAQNKVNKMLQDASEQSSLMNKEANRLLEDANAAKLEARKEKEESTRLMKEAASLMTQAEDRERNLNREWLMLEDRKKKLAEAMR